MAADLTMRGVAARIAPSPFRPGDERSLREDQSSEQRPAGRPRRSGAPAEPMAGRGRIFVSSAFRRGNGRSSGNAARIAPSLFRPGDERILREDQSSEQRPAGRPRRSGAPAEPMAGRGRIFVPSAFRRGNGRRLGDAARIAALLRVGDRSFEEEVQRPECGGQYKARPS